MKNMKAKYMEAILSALAQINDERFLCQIWTILKRHNEKKTNRGGNA